MSQHWHGHWTEDAFTPKRLRNWEVPKWYPSWPDRHCVTTKFIADDNGRILDNAKRVEHSPWGTFKGTWNLPKKITRSIAKELSISSQYKRDSWDAHKKKHQSLCKKIKEHANKDEEKKVIERKL
ncbi:protein Flattop [Temnothorax curvispinosus]|uniref:Cilia- and flagella-associated protein 126 n=1 Tax=Temnothorax curvispinosus TaxID=300111 RepID=A0A6J1PJW6_9HYME|nr:protein Flattop [Temnothorax curvispinosus]